VIRMSRTLIIASFSLSIAFGIGHDAGAQGYFVPGQGQAPAGQARAPARPQATRPSLPAATAPQVAGAENEPPIQVPMPPVPTLPALPRSASPPAAVVGVFGLPEAMRASLAAQQVDKVIGERRKKLGVDAQAEEQAIIELQKALANDRAKLSPEQARAREKEVQDRFTASQRLFRSRDRIIQEAAQVAINAIQANLIAVVRQVSESHGINFVLHRQGVALNSPEFDITEQVVAELNKLMPTVEIALDGVSPLAHVAAPATVAPKPAK
jgi:Skp family chaperone for outer membrane proteins